MPKKIIIPKKYQKYLPHIVLAVVTIFFVLTTLFLFIQLKNATGKKTGADELKTLTGTLSKMMLLPDEPATLATVIDASKLDSQPFYRNAKNGDKVILFKIAKKAILYRPSSNMIIEVAYITGDDAAALAPQINTTSAPTSATGTAALQGTPMPSVTSTISPTVVLSPTPKLVSIAIYNGTKTSGLAASAEVKLKKELSNITVVSKENSANDYVKTTLIDLSGNQKTLLQDMQKIIGGDITTLPAGEKKPTADILIIVGSDQVK